MGRGVRWIMIHLTFIPNCGRFDVIVNKRHVFFKVVAEHSHQLFSLGIIGCLIRPGITRVEQTIINAIDRDRDFETEMHILTEGAFDQRAIKGR